MHMSAGVVALIAALAAPPQLRGRITDSAGHGLPGVRVSAVDLGRVSLVTASARDGSYAFPSLGSGKYRLSFMLSGFRGRWQLVTVGTTVLTVDEVLQLNAASQNQLVCNCDPVVITGEVRSDQRVGPRTIEIVDEAGRPVRGARVELAGLEYLELESGSDGRVRYDALDGDNATFRVSAPGFFTLDGNMCCFSELARVKLTALK